MKGAAIATNEEVTAQNQMIDEIAIDIDHTQHTVQNQTHVARKVTKKHREVHSILSHALQYITNYLFIS